MSILAVLQIRIYDNHMSMLNRRFMRLKPQTGNDIQLIYAINYNLDVRTVDTAAYRLQMLSVQDIKKKQVQEV